MKNITETTTENNMGTKDYLSFLKSKFSDDEIEQYINEIIEEYKGLINTETAKKLLAKENGYSIYKKTIISDVKKGMRSVNLTAKISNIFPIYIREGPSPFKLQRVMLQDETGSTPLVFWNDDTEIIKNELSIGDKIKLKDAYESKGELHYGFMTKIEIIDKIKPTPIKEIKQKIDEGMEPKECTIEGTVVEIYPDYFYIKEGKEKKMSAFKLMDGKDSLRVIIWYEPEQIKKLTEGDRIRIESGWIKNDELHINNYSRIVVLQSASHENIIKGKPIDIKIQKNKMQENEIVVLIKNSVESAEDKLLFLKGYEILQFLGVSSLAADIKPEILINMKKNILREKEFTFKIIKEGDKEYGKMIP